MLLRLMLLLLQLMRKLRLPISQKTLLILVHAIRRMSMDTGRLPCLVGNIAHGLLKRILIRHQLLMLRLLRHLVILIELLRLVLHHCRLVVYHLM